ncbi:hypothetical protein D3C85_1789180 [compost metagenome]
MHPDVLQNLDAAERQRQVLDHQRMTVQRGLRVHGLPPCSRARTLAGSALNPNTTISSADP